MDIINQTFKKFICSIALFTMCLMVNNEAQALDPPQYFASNAPSPYVDSYILYQSPPVHVETVRNVGKQDETPPLRICKPGYAACVTASMFNFDNFNPGDCKLHLLRAEARITKKDTGYYNVNVWYQANETAKESGRTCFDRGGYFTYAIACIPVGNVDPAAITQTNCLIQ